MRTPYPLRRLILPFLAAFLVPIHAGVVTESCPQVCAAMQPFIDREELAGAVMMVATKDLVLSLDAVGWANIAERRPMSTDSVFWIASQTKPITAAALMMLVDEGRLNLDDPVEKYLPEFKGQMFIAEQDHAHVLLKKPAHPITIRNILTHTSGLAFRSAIEVPRLDSLPLADRVRSYAAAPLLYAPDTQFQYGNEGMNTAGRIIEVIARKPYETFLDERLFRPLGMKDTTFWPDEAQLRRLAQPYKPGPERVGLRETPIGYLSYPLSDRVKRFPIPAGGLFATAHDLSRFYQMLLNGGVLDGRRYLSEAGVKEMTKNQTPDLVGTTRGLGFALEEGGFGHAGAYGSDTLADPASGLILIWLAQHAGGPGSVDKFLQSFRQAARGAFVQPDGSLRGAGAPALYTPRAGSVSDRCSGPATAISASAP